jgi:hypothetical protein
MDASSTLDIDIDVLDTRIKAGPSTIIPVNISNGGVLTGADGSASNVQVSFRGSCILHANSLTVSDGCILHLGYRY